MDKKRLWEIKQSANPNTLDMYLYGNVEGDYYDWWEEREVSSETSANYFREELNKYPEASQINIYINSYGGSVFEGTAIYSQLKRHSAFKTVYVDGFACSVASVIAMSADKLIMPSNTMLMIHNAMNGTFGNSKQLRKAADDLDTIMEGNRQAYLDKSKGKITEEKLIELLEAETWLTAEQCMEYGFADEILNQDVDLTGAKQMLQKVNKTLEQELSYNKALVAQTKEFTQCKEEGHKKPIVVDSNADIAKIANQLVQKMNNVIVDLEFKEESNQQIENKPLSMMKALFKNEEEI